MFMRCRPHRRLPLLPHTARGRSGRIWPPAAGTFAHITDGHLGPAAISRPVTARRVGGRHRATSIASITLSYGRGQENARRAADMRDLAVGKATLAHCAEPGIRWRRRTAESPCPGRGCCHGAWPGCAGAIPVTWPVRSVTCLPFDRSTRTRTLPNGSATITPRADRDLEWPCHRRAVSGDIPGGSSSRGDCVSLLAGARTVVCCPGYPPESAARPDPHTGWRGASTRGPEQ